jgi:DNA-binding response OmpR family regulator
MTIREKILVIEDEKSISHFISTVLNNNGYEAMQAQTGEEALSMISSHCPDLVILDLGLPDMDGLDILRSLRSWSSLPVVVVSARSHERDKVAALDLGADDYLTKPFGTDELLAAPRSAIPAPSPVMTKSPGTAPIQWENWSSTTISTRSVSAVRMSTSPSASSASWPCWANTPARF